MSRWSGYELLRELGEPDLIGAPADLSDLAVVGTDAPGERFLPFPSDPRCRMYVAKHADVGDPAQHRFVQPILARQPSGKGELLGLESRTWSSTPATVKGTAKAMPRPTGLEAESKLRPQLPFDTILAPDAIGAGAARALSAATVTLPVRLAVIDARCDGWGALTQVDEQALHRPYGDNHFPRADGAPARHSSGLGHGTLLARVVERIAPATLLGLFEVPRVGNGPLDATDLAAAIGRAAWDWHADIILLPMAEGAWGTPPQLREAVRQAALAGRAGKGIAILCATNRVSANANTGGHSATMSLDDLCNHPLVVGVGACTREGAWYWLGEPVSRLGPGVEVTAPGEALIVEERSGQIADDSSLASALTAATLALVLKVSPELTADELRRLLRLTALRRAADDNGAHPLGARLNERDRLGHNLKVGYGKLRADRAVYAALDPLCHSLLSTRDAEERDDGWLRDLFQRWEETLHRDRQLPVVSSYLQRRASLARRLAREPALEDAAGFLARHLRAIARWGDPLWPKGPTSLLAFDDRLVELADLISGPGAPEADAAFGRLLRALLLSRPEAAVHWLADALGMSRNDEDAAGG